TFESELEQIEERIFAHNAARSNIESLYALKQKLIVMKHAVAPVLEATGKLYGGRVPHICAGMGEYFRDVYDHLHRIHETIEGIREMLTTAIQVNLGMLSLSENEAPRNIAAWAAIIAVPTMIAGIYGMNFKNMPELEWEYGYFAVMGTILIACAGLYWRFKRVGWLCPLADNPRMLLTSENDHSRAAPIATSSPRSRLAPDEQCARLETALRRCFWIFIDLPAPPSRTRGSTTIRWECCNSNPAATFAEIPSSPDRKAL